MSVQTTAVALIGLPRTGKSTYLGALWQLIQDEAEDSVSEVEVTGDRSYLQELGDRVALAEEIDRTEVESDEGLVLTVGFKEHGVMRLEVPDLSGELTRQIVEARVWHERLDRVVRDAKSILLFVHPLRLSLPFTIATANRLLPSDGAPVETISNQKGFSIAVSCTAAKHIDALENVLEFISDSDPVRVGVVISAYDVVDATPPPEQWLEEQLPALASFLRESDRVSEYRVFGVSAQGGELPAERDALLERGDVRDRTYSVGPGGECVPLAEPLKWAIWG